MNLQITTPRPGFFNSTLRTLFGLALFCLFTAPAMAASITATPTTCVDDNTLIPLTAGTQAWTPTGGTVPATASLSRNNPTTHYLKCTGFNFSAIPAGATIDGIAMDVSRYNAARGTIQDAAAYLLKAGAIAGSNYATTTAYPTQTTTGTNETLGTGTTDLWGTSWTLADIQNANFGTAFASTYTGTFNAGHTVGVDALSITVYYTAGGGGGGGSCTTSTLSPSGDTLITCTGSGSITVPSGVTSVQYLVVAGGGGGGGNTGGWGSGGGGAGGMLSGTLSTGTIAGSYTVTVGTGGTGGTGGVSLGSNGGDSILVTPSTTLTASGGGGGSSQGISNNGANGGSGGGGRGNGTGGTGIPGQGNNGGNGGGGGNRSAGGGGGAGGVGVTPASRAGGAGGVGVSNSITGAAVTYAAGGAGGGRDNTQTGGTGLAGAANTGNGGEGTPGNGGTTTGGAGGSGIVIIRYAIPYPAVTSITATDANPAIPGSTLHWTVTFSESVSGVDITDFTLVPTGSVSASGNPTSVTGSGTTWTVTASSGTGTGTLGLNLVDDDTIVSTSSGNKLGGPGTGNGNFTGDVYTIQAPAPIVATTAATGVISTGATLNGTVDDNGTTTTASFEYGLTTGYGASIAATPSSIAAGTGSTSVSAALTGLTACTTYHYRAVGTNTAGTVSNGGDQSFTTSGCPATGVINTYYPGIGSVSAGATSITLGTATGATTPISAGDMLLIMQMQDATMDSSNTATYGTVSASNAGKYEYAIASNSVPLSGGTLNISCGILNAYTDAAASGTSGQHRYQIIRVPVYTDTTLTPALTALTWNGSTGGVLALDATGTVNLNSATVSVDGEGFRGGGGRNSTSGSGANTDYVTPVTNLANGSKGEGIAGTPDNTLTPPGTSSATGSAYPNGSYARGAPGNGGGGATDIDPAANDQNPGGGGGGNGGTGGIGGIGWCPTFNAGTTPTYGCGLASLVSASNPNGSTGGIGGSPVSGLGTTLLPLGGGGGAGTTNNNTGTYGAPSSSGAPGGGIIMMRAGSLSGTATFNANGSNGDQTVANDGAGGGGAGGTVLVSAGSGIGGLTINANGGTGGSTLVPGLRVPNTTATPHGPGGGGGGGFIITSGAPAATSVAGGSNGVTYNGGSATPFTDANGSYGATPGSSGSVNSGLVAAAIPGTTLGSTSCASSIDHFAINIGAASGSTCTPKSITITAQDASNGTVTGYTGLVSITTAPAHGDWSAGTPAPGGTLTPGTADSGSASYQFVAGDNGVATFNLSDQHADGSLTISVADSTLPTSLSTSSPISFSDNAFVITNDSVQVAGRPQAMNVAMWRKDPSTGVCSVSPYYTGSKNLKAWLTVDAADPGGAAPVIGALSLPNAQPAGNNLSLTFAAGSANFNLDTSDVGKYALNLRDDSGTFASGGNIISSSSSTITTRPFALVVSDIKQGTTLNPANNGSTGSVFAKAGTSFQATVGAYLWNSAADSNSDGIPDAGATLAQITANGATPSYKWTTTLAAGTPYTPAAGVIGSLANGVQSGTCPTGSPNCFTSGIATPDNLSYSEVGSFTLGVSATGFLGTTGVDMTGANGLALVFDNTPALDGVVGRFIPDHFGVSANSIVNRGDLCPTASGCPSTFTYMGERMDAAFTLTALAAGGTTTQNYETSNGFAKLDPTAAANPLGLTALDDNGTTRTPLNPLDTSLPATCSPTPCFIGGVAIIDAPIAVTRGAAPAGPYTAVNVGINPSESDGVKTIYDIDTTNVVAGAFDHTRIGTTTEYYGQIAISNAIGSELLPLPIDLTTEYYDGTGYVTNGNDSISSFNTANLTFTNCAPLSAVSTWPTGTGGACPPTSPSPASVVFSSGIGGYTLSAPGNSKTGSVDMNISVPSYLPSNTARATFGVYTDNSDFIYLREQY